MNFITRQFSLYPREITLYSAIIALQCCRVSVFSSSQTLGSESVSGSVILLLLCICLNLYVVYRERNYIPEAIQGTKMLLLYMSFGVLSVFWSPVPNAITILPKCLEVLSSYLMMAVVLWKIKERELCLLYLLQLCTIASLFGYLPGLVAGSVWQHSSFFPMTGAMGCLLALGLKRIVYYQYSNYYFAINFAIMILGTSSTTYIAFACGLFILMSSKKYGVRLFYVIIVAIAFLSIYHFIQDDLLAFVFKGKSSYAMQTASGREYIWEHALVAWRNNPLFGQGFIVAERNLHLIGGSTVQILSTHNGYLSVILGTGIVGSIIFGVFFIKTWIKCFSCSFYDSIGPIMTILLPPLVVLTVNNLSIHALGGAWDISTPAVFALLLIINTLKDKLPIDELD